MKLKKYAAALSCLCLTAAMFTGCANGEVPETTETAVVTEQSLEDTLNALTLTPRWSGTVEEQTARTYIMDTLAGFGYKVEEQPFEFVDASGIQGIQTTNTTANIIATQKAENPDADILIVSSHFDSVAGTPGANDNASGTTVLLETAKAVAGIPTDTEIRFIAFGAEELGLQGSAHYVSTLSEEEKSRIIGDIQLDMLGHYRSKEVLIAAPADVDTLVGNLLNESAEKLTGSKMNTTIESASDHTSFISGGIPAVLLMQDNLGVENHKVTDQASMISVEKLKAITDILVDTVKTVAGRETTDLAKTAYEITDTQNASYIITDETILFFGEKKELNDGRIGGPGKLVGERHDDDLDWDFETYHYNTQWFGVDEVVPTEFEYRVLDGARYLERVTIDYAGSSYSMEQVADTLSEKYGAPYISEETSIWESTLSNRQYLLEKGSTEIQVYSGYVGSGNSIGTYDLSGGIEQYADAPAREYKLLEFLSKIVGDDSFVDTLEVWTDGLSYQLGATYPTQEDKNDKFTMRIDVEDVFDENGDYRNLDKTLVTFVHEYGHVLTLNNTQVDLSKKDPNVFLYNKDCFMEGSYLLDFYNRFWQELNTESAFELYFEHPDWFINQYASQDSNEDIAESFAMFVLTDKPDGDTVAEEKINFFHDYPELIAIRDRIRTAFEI